MQSWRRFLWSEIGTLAIFYLTFALQEKDKNQSGTIHVDQIAEIFRMYEVNFFSKLIKKL